MSITTKSMEKEKRPMSQRAWWHLIFGYVLELEFQVDSDKFEVSSEYELNKQSPRIDYILKLLNPQDKIHHPLAAHFRIYNLFEYKSPSKSYSYQDYLKTISHAGLYANQKHMRNQANQITVNIVTDKCTRNFWETLYDNQCKVTKIQAGIYHIADYHFPVQLTLRRRVFKETCRYLHYLGRDLACDEVEMLFYECYNERNMTEGKEAYWKFLFEQNHEKLEEAIQMIRGKIIDYQPNFSPGVRKALIDLVAVLPEGKKLQEDSFEQGRMQEREQLVLSLLKLHDDQTISEIVKYPIEKVQELRMQEQ